MGVGTTYQMLLEGHRLKGRRLDAVVVFVETHGRPDTARLLKGLEVMPLRQIEYLGVLLEEMDLEAVLARKPDVVLIDELAHTNIPGSRHMHRYQDARELLAAGIDVIATLKIQNLESLADTVERITGAKIRERVPDSVFDDADEIVNVDITVEDLLRRSLESRLHAGDGYQTRPPDWFTDLNLEILRELAARKMPVQTSRDSRTRRDEETALTTHPIMVFLPSGEPTNERILRYASNLAAKLNLNWFAVYAEDASLVTAKGEKPTRVTLSGSAALANALGATVCKLKGEDVVDGLLRLAVECRAGHIVVGTPTAPSGWERLMRQKNLMEQLIQRSAGIAVVIVDTRTPEPFISSGYQAPTPSRDETEETTEAAVADLAAYVSPGSIVILERPVSKEAILHMLARVASRDLGQGVEKEIVRQVLSPGELSSSLIKEEAAFPNALVEGIPSPSICLAIAKSGISDARSEQQEEPVFLVLCPANQPEFMIPLQEMVRRTVRNRSLTRRLKSSRTPEDAFAAIQDYPGGAGV
jgi:two-component system, OmpR family, sensor histidine kinase KdpD